MNIPETLDALRVDVDSLRPHPSNARKHDDAGLQESLTVHGQYRPIVVQSSTRMVLAGNGTLAAATALDWSQVAATFVDVDDETALRILAVDNRLSDNAAYDELLLVDLLDGLPDLAGTGYDADYLNELLRRTQGVEGSRDPDAEWEGMPDYETKDVESVFRVTVHFATHDDADDFFATISRTKRSSLWWPERDAHIGSSPGNAYVAVDT